VYLKDGTIEWYLIHIEVQSYFDKNFSKRLYLYNSRTFNKYDKPVITLALITEESESFRPSEYKVAHRTYELSFKFPVIKIIDYKDRTDELKTSMNPFAIATFAYLRLIESKDDVEKKYKWKKALIADLYEKGFSREDIAALFKFIDWIIRIPTELEKTFREEIIRIKSKEGISVEETMHTIESMAARKKAVDIALEMLANGEPVDKIAKYTKLTEEEIKDIAKTSRRAA